MKVASIVGLVFVLLSASWARAEGGADPFAFELTEEPKKSPAEIAAEKQKADLIADKVRTRRRTLTTHQTIGFVTLGLLAATLVLGTLNYVDKFDGEYTGKYNTPHLLLASAASATFTTGALLGLFAPNPYPKPVKWDAALAHKVLMGFAAACFVTNLVLGPISASRAGELDQKDFALAHLVVGYGAFAFMGAGTLTWVFK